MGQSWGEAVVKVAARLGNSQHTKRALKEGTNGLSTGDAQDYRHRVGCLEDVLTDAGTEWVIGEVTM